MNFIFATHNDHKVREVEKILDVSGLNLQSLKELDFRQEIAEDGSTLEENAWIKANTIRDIFGGNVVAEDTGLEVYSLNFRPGIHTARYAGEKRDDEANMKRLLQELESTDDRRARFRTILAVWYEDNPYAFEGIIEGIISPEILGSGGFGYDPVFVPRGFQATFGQLPDKIKNGISHRSAAFRKFRDFLRLPGK